MRPKTDKAVQGGRNNGAEADEIAKEIKKVKRQNFITHCLLTAMIILTVTWQLSEVSLLLTLKDRVSHPFRSVGSAVAGMFKKPTQNGEETEKESSSTPQQNETHSLPQLKMPGLPELPQMNMPEMRFNGGDKH